MAAISSAQQFFDTLVTGGVPAIEALVDDHQHETEWLEFKTGQSLNDDQIKSFWSEAIAGFATNQGGVLIWGISARKNPETDIDEAESLKPYHNAAALRSRLYQLLPDAAEPPVVGVDVRAFVRNGDANGYVVCLIPESDAKPHRAELMKNQPYRLRVGDSFRNPSPSILRLLFFPHSSPQFEVYVQPEWTAIDGDLPNPPNDIEIRFTVRLRNSGLVTAKDVFVIVSSDVRSITIDAPYKTGKDPTDVGTGITPPRPLHPTSNCNLCTISRRVPVARQKSIQGASYVPHFTPVTFSFDVFAADMLPLKVHVVIGDGEVHMRHEKQAVQRHDRAGTMA